MALNSVDSSSVVSDQAQGQISVAAALREGIISKISDVLKVSNLVGDSSTRLQLQSSCLDVVIDLEALIEQFNLERRC